MQIGFIGLGRMGLPMAKNLIDAGHPVTGYDIDPEQVSALEQAGGTGANDLKDAATDADVVITVLRTPTQVTEVADEILPVMSEGAIFADMSSIDPITAQDIADRSRDYGIRMVDAPVSGGVVGAKDGTLAIMTGGDPAVLDEVDPLFEVMGGNIFHAGDHGTGQAIKLCNQMLVGGQAVLLAEAFQFGEAAGIDPQILHDVLLESAGRGGVLEIKGDKLVSKDFDPGFDINLQAKDLRLGLESAEEYDVSTYAVATVFQTFLEARRAGLGDRDHLAVYDLRNRSVNPES